MVDFVSRSAPTIEKAVAGVSKMLEGIVRELVNLPERVVIYQVIENSTAKFTVWVDATDLERVIGLEGQTQQSLRTVIRAMGRKDKYDFSLAIVGIGVSPNSVP